jgi:hypothetical protein
MIKYVIDYFYRREQVKYAAQEPVDFQKHIKYWKLNFQSAITNWMKIEFRFIQILIITCPLISFWTAPH